MFVKAILWKFKCCTIRRYTSFVPIFLFPEATTIALFMLIRLYEIHFRFPYHSLACIKLRATETYIW